MSRIKKWSKRRKVVTALALLALLAVAGGAYAWLSSTGSGNVTATGGGSTTLSITGTAGNVYPGLAGQAQVDVSVTNSGKAAEYINTISQSGPVQVTGDTPPGACDPSWFSLAGSPVSVGQQVFPGTTDLGPILTINETDAPVSQDACIGATITVPLVSN